MSHQRYPSHDPVKEPHSISLKVLRLSRPSLVAQHPLRLPFSPPASHPAPLVASLAYSSNGETNPEFILSPILNLPPSFGSAYVGETFSCTLCANHDALEAASGLEIGAAAASTKQIRDVRIEAEMKTPGSASAIKLDLCPGSAAASSQGVDLTPGQTLQRVVNFDLKEEGSYVLAVTISYYEATDTSGRTRTFRKLYQFICKASLIVRTKAGPLPAARQGARRWVLEAQLENCSEETLQLDRVLLDLLPSLSYTDCNWEADRDIRQAMMHPGEVEQVCFVVEAANQGLEAIKDQDDRITFGTLGVGWRSEMGNRGFLSTGKLGTRHE